MYQSLVLFPFSICLALVCPMDMDDKAPLMILYMTVQYPFSHGIISENLQGLFVMVTGKKCSCTEDTLWPPRILVTLPEFSTTWLKLNPVNWSILHTGGSGWFNPQSGPACPLGKTSELWTEKWPENFSYFSAEVQLAPSLSPIAWKIGLHWDFQVS